MQLAILLVLTAVFYGLYNVFIKISSNNMHPLSGMLMLQLGAILIGVSVFAYLKATKFSLVFTPRGVTFAFLAGVFVALAETTTFYLFSKGVPASVGIPSIVGGGVVASALLGFFLLREPLAPIQIGAIAMVDAGIAVLAGR